MKKGLEKLLDLIDVEWIRENPDTALELVQILYNENNRRKYYIELLNKKILLGAALLEGMKGNDQ